MIIPAIDLINGQIVRLFKGRYDQVTTYDRTPLDLVQTLSQSGAQRIHIVDLQGAKNPEARQTELLRELAAATETPIQTGGGVRTEEDVEVLLSAGVEKVIIGSLAITQPKRVRNWIQGFGPEHIVLALDVTIDATGQKQLPIHGWQDHSDHNLESLLEQYLGSGLRHVLCTDISRDGTLTGANRQLYSELQRTYRDIRWQASGGIGSLEDIALIAKTGVSGVIVGKALLDGLFTLEESIECWQNV